jgi:hypothetical protein
MIRCAKGTPEDKPYEDASTIGITMDKTTTSADPGRCKLVPVAGNTSTNSKTTTATTTTPGRVENNDIDSDVDDSDCDVKPAATSGRISMIADDDSSDGDTTAVMEDFYPALATSAAALGLDLDDDDDDDDPPFWAYADVREVTDSNTSETNNNEIVVPSPIQATRSRFPAIKSATRHSELTETYVPDLHRKPTAAASSPKTKTNRRGRPPKGDDKKECESIDPPVLESQTEKDQLLQVGDVIYAPYPGKCPSDERKYPIDL